MVFAQLNSVMSLSFILIQMGYKAFVAPKIAMLLLDKKKKPQQSMDGVLMSPKTMLGMLQVWVQKKLKKLPALREKAREENQISMLFTYEGYEDAMNEVLQLLWDIEKTVQEEMPCDK